MTSKLLIVGWHSWSLDRDDDNETKWLDQHKWHFTEIRTADELACLTQERCQALFNDHAAMLVRPRLPGSEDAIQNLLLYKPDAFFEFWSMVGLTIEQWLNDAALHSHKQWVYFWEMVQKFVQKQIFCVVTDFLSLWDRGVPAPITSFPTNKRGLSYVDYAQWLTIADIWAISSIQNSPK